MKYWVTISDGLDKPIHGPTMIEAMEYEYAEERAQELMEEHHGTKYDISDEPPEDDE